MAVDLKASFTYHKPDKTGIEAIGELRKLGLELAQAIAIYVGDTADGTLAIRDVENACMRANKAIAIKFDEGRTHG